MATIEEKFWTKVDRRKVGECWHWRGAMSGSGYGVLGQEYAHRIAWALAHGPVPEGAYVLHGCDDKVCVNHRHLHLGDHLTNMAESAARGRHRHGEDHHRSKIKLHQVHQIRALRAEGVPVKVLAERYGISPTHVSAIAQRKAWKSA